VPQRLKDMLSSMSAGLAIAGESGLRNNRRTPITHSLDSPGYLE
jgi:hypothetical protein